MDEAGNGTDETKKEKLFNEIKDSIQQRYIDSNKPPLPEVEARAATQRWIEFWKILIGVDLTPRT